MPAPPLSLTVSDCETDSINGYTITHSISVLRNNGITNHQWNSEVIFGVIALAVQ